MNRGARAVLPVYKTTPTAVLVREAGWGTAAAWLYRICSRYTIRVAAADPRHPLRRRWDTARFKWLRQNMDVELSVDISNAPWNNLDRDHIRREVGAVGRQAGSQVFNHWLTEEAIGPLDLTIYSDGSMDDRQEAGAGSIIFRGCGPERECLSQGIIPLGNTAEVYDAEIAGAVGGLQAAFDNPWSPGQGNVTIILDNEEAALRLHSGVFTASSSSNLNHFQRLRAAWAQGALSGGQRDVSVRWCPGHAGLQGNEIADGLAKAACQEAPVPARKLTIARAKRKIKEGFQTQNEDFWKESAPRRYTDIGINMTRQVPPELHLPRKHLACLLAARSGHGDFAAYHERFNHTEFTPTCQCGRDKTPEHFLFCSLGKRRSRLPAVMGISVSDKLQQILGTNIGAQLFANWCETTSFFDDIQKR